MAATTGTFRFSKRASMSWPPLDSSVSSAAVLHLSWMMNGRRAEQPVMHHAHNTHAHAPHRLATYQHGDIRASNKHARLARNENGSADGGVVLQPAQHLLEVLVQARVERVHLLALAVNRHNCDTIVSDFRDGNILFRCSGTERARGC